ncbi:MAG: Ig-like domain-containing protein [Lachnospiraceae bacterium]|nr:Ig-like domain-containing protein [Lachnospiraceae bacterium]
MKTTKKILVGLLTAALVLAYVPGLTLSAADTYDAADSTDDVSAVAEAEEVESTEVTEESASDFDSDAALLKYLSPSKPAAGRGPRRALQRTYRSTLTANEKIVYDKTLAHFQAIVDGTSQDGSTPVEIAYTELTAPATQFTFSELGVTLTNNQDTDKTAISNALAEKFSFDQKKVTSALTADYPEYFFWFGRTMGTLYAWKQGTDFVDVSQSSITFTMNAAVSYAVVDAADKKYYPEKIDTEKIKAIGTAKTKVREIVDAAASLDDYAKLKSYISTIASLNTYNKVAAAQDDDYVHTENNPWEIIYVFDGNPDTNVVCEGYAKSFKFLIDNSSFSSDVTAFTITGKVSTTDKAEGHMWNIIRIDGVGYHADPTWCDRDDGDIINWGEFLPGVTKTDGGYNVTYPNYPEGASSYYKGGTAYYVFDDNTKAIYTAGELNVSETAYTPTVAVTGITLDHSTLSLTLGTSQQLTATVEPTEATTKTVNWTSSDTAVATVDENGNVTPVAAGTTTITATANGDPTKTAICEVTVTDPVVPVTAVKLTEKTLTVSVNGSSKLNFTIEPGNATNKAVTWTSSDESVATVSADGTVTGHKAGGTATITAASAENAIYFDTCKVTVGDYTYQTWTSDGADTHTRVSDQDPNVKETRDHVWDKEEVTKEATCTEKGSKKVTCTTCGYSKTVEIPALGHVYGEWKDLGNGKHQRTCLNNASHIENGDHAFGPETTTPATCTTDGHKTSTCNVCGATKTESIAALGHNYGAWTDTGDGKTHKRICSNDQSHVETAVHDWGTGVQETPATCGTAGVMKFTCKDCHATKTESIRATGNHTWSEWKQTKAPTCAPGEEERECSVCHQKETREVAAVGQHRWSDWSQTKDPTCETAGEETRTCSFCNTKEKRTVAALGHDWSATWTDAKDGKTHYKTCSRDASHKLTENHTFGAWTTTKEPTETATGEREHTCSVCGAVVKESIPVKTPATPSQPTNPTTPTNPTNPSTPSTPTNPTTPSTPTTPTNTGSNTGTNTGNNTSSSTGNTASTGTGSNSTGTGSVVANTDAATTTITAPAGASAEASAAVAALNTAANTGTSGSNTAPQLVTGTGWLSSVNAAAKAAESLPEVQSFISAHANEKVTVTAKPRIEVAVKAADTAKISYEITPKYDIVVSAGSDSRTISTNAKVPVAAVVTVNIPIPTSFAGEGSLLYVTHKLDDGSVRFYSGRVASGVLSFANPDGFSEFIVSTAKPEGFVETAATKNVFRLYDKNRGEHFYTTSETEMNLLVKTGWRLEGVGYKTVATSDTPVYRLYNSHDGGMHFFTIYASERDALVKAGWKYEGISFYSGGTTPVYRAYNPNSTNGEHNYTINPAEQARLKAIGWKDEGISWYAAGN